MFALVTPDATIVVGVGGDNPDADERTRARYDRVKSSLRFASRPFDDLSAVLLPSAPTGVLRQVRLPSRPFGLSRITAAPHGPEGAAARLATAPADRAWVVSAKSRLPGGRRDFAGTT
ncbi:hypothetical protein [Streptomyces noursei]|uniref:hypothetical protein n=1 Tax=Streptomyces noursei TaxID=1971 RepID=UPI0016730169|nr:hypothetical protein [Streptomyces noursei]MCZ1018851.1 hypothetical protein [Streptomyces noursei]GGX22131.1 hypothetical protein GCM10010341_49310 [Streptomyces noursei]